MSRFIVCHPGLAKSRFHESVQELEPPFQLESNLYQECIEKNNTDKGLCSKCIEAQVIHN